MTVAVLNRLRLQNPVLWKDLRTRMRGTRAFLVQGLYVGILALSMGVAYLFQWRTFTAAGSPPVAFASQLGRGIYLVIFWIQAAMVVVVTPTLTASAITIEHEQRTYELLVCTRLIPRTILVGKLLSGWLFVVMLLTCSLPMSALCLMLGGVSGSEIFWNYVVLCLFALLFASVGILFSSIYRRSVQSVPLAYVCTFLFASAASNVGPMQGGPFWTLNLFAWGAAGGSAIGFFSFSIPAWLPVVILLPLACLLMLNLGIQRVPHFVADRALAIRLLTAGLLVTFMLLAMGGAGAGALGYAAGIGLGCASLLIVMPASFATGYRPRSWPRSLVGWLLGGLDPRRMFSSELSGGWAYVLVLVALYSATLLLAPSVPGGQPALDVWAIFVFLASIVFCYSALGALGAAFDSRSLGVAPILLLYTFNWLVTGFIWTTYRGAVTQPGPAEQYALQLSPFVGLMTLFGYGSSQTQSPLPGPWGGRPFWEVSAILHLIVAVAALAVAEMVYQVYRRRALLREAPVEHRAESGE